MKPPKNVYKNHPILPTIKKITKKQRVIVKKELKKIKFRAKPTIIIILTLFILIIPKYRRYAWDVTETESTFFLRVILPIVILLFVFREKLTDYGLGLGAKKKGLILYLLFIVGYSPFFWILIKNNSFTEYYQLTISHLTPWKSFAINEINSLYNLFKDEFIFRGFLLFGLRKDLGDFNAILVQTIPYVLLHIGKPEIECYGSVMVGIALGYLAIKTKSIWYGLLLHWTIASALNFIIVHHQLS